jgi:hypothetical protein
MTSTPHYPNPFNNFWIILLLILAISGLVGCTKPIVIKSGVGLPDDTYKSEPVYTGPLNSVGTLTEGYVRNTKSLIIVNDRLNTLCVAHKIAICEVDLTQ